MSTPTKTAQNTWLTQPGQDFLQLTVEGGGIVSGIDPTGAPYGALGTGGGGSVVTNSTLSGNGTSGSPLGIASVPVSALPSGIVTNGLLAEYRILPTETPSALIDYSGNGNNAVGTDGVAPTIVAGSGGVLFANNGAIKLPAALNGALTMQVFVSFQEPSGGQTPQAMVLGNGNGSTSNTRGMAFIRNAGGVDVPPDAGSVSAIGGASGVTAQSWAHFAGIGFISYVIDTSDRLYVNGKEFAYESQSTAAGQTVLGNLQLGGCAAGSGFTAQTYFGGTIYYAIFYNRVLTPQEVAQNSNAVIAAMANRGVNLSLGSTLTNAYVIFQGDSITSGNGTSPTAVATTQSFSGSPNNLSSFLAANIGVSGRTLGGPTGIIANAPLEIYPLFHNTSKNILILWGGTNDNQTTTAGAQSLVDGLYKVATAAVNSVGGNQSFKCGIVTMLSRNLEDSSKDILNPLLRTQVPNWSPNIFLIDMAADQRLGADGASSNTTYFQVDQVHPNTNSAQNIEAPVFSRAINRAWGAQDFSSCNVYNSPAPAAATVSTATQSGNTVTITTSAPHGFLNGQVVTLAGIGVAGYNGTYTILSTPTGSTFTYFNPITGLGASSAGTASVPLQQDGDKYQVINFGTGNYTLQSCLGYTGQKIYIKNINSSSSTIVPFAGSANRTAETIDGLSSITLAANSFVVLQAVLTSQNNGGCNWVTSS